MTALPQLLDSKGLQAELGVKTSNSRTDHAITRHRAVPGPEKDVRKTLRRSSIGRVIDLRQGSGCGSVSEQAEITTALTVLEDVGAELPQAAGAGLNFLAS
jgi:hypothetical protein